MNAQKRNRAFGLYIAVILILALLWVLRDNSSGFGQNSLYTYAQFEHDLKSENVVSVIISQNREVHRPGRCNPERGFRQWRRQSAVRVGYQYSAGDYEVL